MSKLKVVIALGAGILGMTLLGDAKKASAAPAPATPTPPSPPAPVAPKKPARRKAASAAPEAPLSPEKAAEALAQVWPLITAGRASADQLDEALEWARVAVDTEKAAVIRAKLGM